MDPYRLFNQSPGLAFRNGAAHPKEWKQEAHGDRFGNSYARHVIREALEYGASAMLREDNRYVPSLDTGFWKGPGMRLQVPL